MKAIDKKVQKVYEAAVRMVMIKEGKSLAEAQLIVLEVVKEYKKSDEYGRLTPVTTDILKELIMTLEVTFLEKKLDHVIHNFLK